jgi:phosphatidate phosphatase PAH1
MHNTGNVKANMIRTITKLFPGEINPLVGGLGNRDSDAVAYRAVGIPSPCIYIVSKQSQIMTLD